MKNKIFVLGNGESRLAIDIKYLREHGRIYGCNALYREFTPDVLVSVDDRMSTEILESGYEGTHYYRVLRKDRTKDNVYDVIDRFGHKITKSRGYSSGALATLIAANEAQVREVYLIGFDMYKTEQVNNVYKDSPNYIRSTDRPIDTANFKIQMSQVVRECKTRKFIWVNDYHRMIINEPNFELMYVSEFKELFQA